MDLSESFLSDEMLYGFIIGCPNMTSLNLDSCSGLVNLVDFPNRLNSLNMCLASELSDIAFERIARLEQLTYLDISSTKATDYHVIPIAQHCTLLETWVLTCTRITAVGLQAVLHNCHDLTKLNLSCCDSIVDWDSMDWSGVPLLRTLDINFTSIIDAGLRLICLRCPLLCVLNISCCRNITDVGVDCLLDSACFNSLLTVYGGNSCFGLSSGGRDKLSALNKVCISY